MPSLDWGRGALSVDPHSEHAHRLGDVLDRLFPEILEREIELALDLLIDGARDADATRLGQPFQSRRDVHRIPVDPIAFRRDVSHVHSDAKKHPPVLGQTLVPHPEDALDLHSALNRIEGIRELRQHVVAGRIDYAAVVVRDEADDEVPVGRERLDRSLLVVRHETRVAHHIGGEDGGQAALQSHGESLHRGASAQLRKNVAPRCVAVDILSPSHPTSA